MSGDRVILLVGCGNMGAALLRGWLAQGVPASSISVVDPQEAALERARELGVSATRSPASGVEPAIVVFAIKPQQLDTLLESYRALARHGTLVLSIAAGKPIGWFESVLGDDVAIVRAMPNTPAAIGQGITALVANGCVDSKQRATAEKLMQAVGEVVWIDNEALMDAVTAISGSGPAYVFLLIEALVAAAQQEGLAPALAQRLARATVAGAGAYAASSALEPPTLREQVTSPGGTTQAALEVLMAADGLSELIRRAVSAAAARSRELAQPTRT